MKKKTKQSFQVNYNLDATSKVLHIKCEWSMKNSSETAHKFDTKIKSTDFHCIWWNKQKQTSKRMWIDGETGNNNFHEKANAYQGRT